MTDQKKLEKLFKQHYRQMYRLATILLHDDAESKDVVHDIFAHLLRNSQDLREETAESYLLTSGVVHKGSGTLCYKGSGTLCYEEAVIYPIPVAPAAIGTSSDDERSYEGRQRQKV